jgi:ubiquinone/menaquinone biosynthesis C-methylase UbiE
MYKRKLTRIPSFKLISMLASGRIIDVGCGLGYLSQVFVSYIGIDVDKEALIIAKKNTGKEFVVASALALPFRSNSFDTCISYDSIEHVEETDRAIAEMRRVGRKLVLSLVDFSSYYRYFSYDATHKKILTPSYLARLLRIYFLRVNIYRTSGLFSVPRIINEMLSRLLPNQVIFECFR